MIKFDGFPKHSKVFQTRIKEQEIFSDFLFQTNNKKSNNLKKNSFLNSCGRQPWNYAASTSNFFDEMSHYRKSTKEINVKLEKIANKNTRQVLWENFTHPTAFFERQDVDEWDLKIKRNIKKTGLFVPNTKTEGFFEKTLKDYN